MTDEQEQNALNVITKVNQGLSTVGVVPRAIIAVALGLLRIGTAIFTINDTLDQKFKDKDKP